MEHARTGVITYGKTLRIWRDSAERPMRMQNLLFSGRLHLDKNGAGERRARTLPSVKGLQRSQFQHETRSFFRNVLAESDFLAAIKQRDDNVDKSRLLYRV